ncbi:MAG: efflux RND transporter periplasmic adaptor subunit [Candidatus Polarisedimenticolia bacterium]
MSSSPRRRLLVFGVVVVLALAGLTAAGLALFGRKGRTETPAAAGGSDAAGGAVVNASNRDSKKGDKDGDDKEKTAIPVSVSPAGSGAVSAYITSTANLVAEDEVKLLAEAEGRVGELHVEEGHRVTRGQVLASLARQEQEILVRKAEVRSDSTRQILERAQKMAGDRLISPEAFDKAKTDHDVAEQELAEARWRLDRTLIRAPFTGRVTERSIRIGQHVRPGDILFTVSDFDPLIARIYLPEKDVLGLREGREARITLKADERTRFRGRIRQISPVVDPATGTVKLTVEAVTPPPEVRPGAFVTIDIVRETHERAVLLPREAVIRDQLDTYVFVARDGVAEKRRVALGFEEAGRVEAISGIKPGEQVVVAGQGSLKDGAAVKVVPAAEAGSDLGRTRTGPRVG